MAIVSISTELQMPADTACRLAATPDVMMFVLAPVLSLSRENVPPPGTVVEPGILRHRPGEVVRPDPELETHDHPRRERSAHELYTTEHGGPLKVWNHRLTFEPITENSCRYTDQIEIEDGAAGWLHPAVHPPAVPAPAPTMEDRRGDRDGLPVIPVCM